ncbi:MAG: GTPase, partial [Clostridia bacterium]
MSKPIIAIVGRPNVGKSTFFNKVAGSRISIVVNTPGVTRDRIYADGEWLGKQFTMIDTGGIELKSDDTMHKHIKEQAELAIDIADIILFFVDGREPLTSDDINIASILRKTKKPILLVVNKIDNFQTQDYSEFYSLGLDLFPISSEQKYGVGDLLDNIVERFPDIDTEKEAEGIKIAVVGKPNAGKSSLVNKILGYDR